MSLLFDSQLNQPTAVLSGFLVSLSVSLDNETKKGQLQLILCSKQEVFIGRLLWSVNRRLLADRLRNIWTVCQQPLIGRPLIHRPKERLLPHYKRLRQCERDLAATQWYVLLHCDWRIVSDKSSNKMVLMIVINYLTSFIRWGEIWEQLKFIYKTVLIMINLLTSFIRWAQGDAGWRRRMHEGTMGCRRAQEDAGGHNGMQEGAGGCMRAQWDAQAGIINQAEDRETRMHSFEVTMAFYGK